MPPIAFAKAIAPPPHDGLHHLDRPGRDQHGDGRRAWPMSTACRCCCCPATSSPTAGPIRCCSRSRISATAPSRPTTASARSRAISTASPGPSRSSRRSHRAMTVLTDPAECGPVTLALCQDVQAEAYDYPESFFAERVWTPRRIRARRGRARGGRRAAEARAKKPLIVAGGGVLYSRGRGRAGRRSPTRTAFPSPRPRPASAPCRTTIRWTWARSASPAPAPPTRWPRRPTWCSPSAPACRISPPAPGRCSRTRARRIIGLNSQAFDAAQARRACRWSRDARAGLEDLRAGARRLAAPTRPGRDRASGRQGALAEDRRSATPARPTRPALRRAGDRRGAARALGDATSWSAPPAACRASCTSCGRRARPAATTSNTATPAWATRSPAASASRWREPDARGRRHGRRRLLPDDEFGDRHLGDARA